MIWGKQVPDPRKFNLNAPEGSEEKILARTAKFYPGSWLPANKEQIIRCAKPYFKFMSSNNGRLDYIETLPKWAKWDAVLKSPIKMMKALWGFIVLLPKFRDKDFRTQLEFLRHEDQVEIFKREIFSHERMFFEKK